MECPICGGMASITDRDEGKIIYDCVNCGRREVR